MYRTANTSRPYIVQHIQFFDTQIYRRQSYVQSLYYRLYTNVRTNIDDFALYGQEMTNQVAHSHSDFNRAARTIIILCILIDFFVRYDADINLYLFSILLRK